MKNSHSQEIAATTLATPIGKLFLAASPRGLQRVEFPGERSSAVSSARSQNARSRAHLARAARQLREYFAGRRTAFDLPLDLAGSDYQQRVWRALVRIPAGRTLTYGAVAAQLGSKNAARAVGRACATNPIPVVVPCHRVVDSRGELHGYGGGLWRKQLLLDLERSAT